MMRLFSQIMFSGCVLVATYHRIWSGDHEEYVMAALAALCIAATDWLFFAETSK